MKIKSKQDAKEIISKLLETLPTEIKLSEYESIQVFNRSDTEIIVKTFICQSVTTTSYYSKENATFCIAELLWRFRKKYNRANN